jgi:small subunit ribosomal protein S9
MTTEQQQRYFYGLGRRKASVARVRLYPGNGTVIINGRPFEDALPRESLRYEVMQPLEATESARSFNVQVKVQGGGVSGWAGAISHGVARALVVADESNRRPLRAGGFLTRDPRIKERKKPGLKRARKAPQFTKR